MAERRMFSKSIIDSDMFLDMPATTQNLYFHLNMRADDEGFIDSPKKIMRIINANQNDLDVLIAKRYILIFESGVVVIKHWKLHNSIRKDRFTETLYLEEKAQLNEKDNGAYTFNKYNNAIKNVSNSDLDYLEGSGNQMTTKWQPNGNQMTTKCPHRLGKDSIVEDSLGKNSIVEEKEKNTKKEKPYIPSFSLPDKITEAIKHWNTKKNLPSCKYSIFTLPDVANVKTKFDVFRDGEILKAIDNLDICYDKIDPNYRPKAFHRFIINSLDNWLDEAEPLKNYDNPKQKKSRTLDEESYMQLLRLKENHDVDQETFDKIRNQCIKSLADKGIEFDDEYYRV